MIEPEVLKELRIIVAKVAHADQASGRAPAPAGAVMATVTVPARLGIPAGLFRASLRVGRQAGKPAAKATQQRSIPDSLHLAMLEPVYRLAPDLLRSGRVRPPQDMAATRELRMTDFRLLCPGGFYHALARYGPDLWTPFTYAGLHATERSLRRKEQHRFWGADRYFRIGNRLFYEDPDQAVEPSGQIVVAADSWARELARNTLSSSTPTLFCTPDGQCSETVELRPSRDLVSDPAGHPTVGRPEQVGLWLREIPTWKPSPAERPTGCL